MSSNILVFQVLNMNPYYVATNSDESRIALQHALFCCHFQKILRLTQEQLLELLTVG